jgi:NADH-quinone oxidoreductase subunit N
MLAVLAQTGTSSIQPPPIAWRAVTPFLVMVGGAALLLVASGLSRTRPGRGVYALFTVVVAGVSMATAMPLWREVQDSSRGPFRALAGAINVDGFSVFFTFVIGISVVLAALLADGYLRREGLERAVGAELYVLLLFSASGGLIMASANDLIVVFLGLEILSIAAYVLAAMHARRIQSQEAALKYFVLGAFSSAFFLYGIALVYGATGTTNLTRIFNGPAAGSVVSGKDLLGGSPPAILLAGLALLLVGFGFKIALVPFHAWAPDVYQGSPTPVVAYMAAGVKAAGFAALLRVFVTAFAGYADDWRPYVYVLAVATLLVGAVVAVVQSDVKRMMAYSSIMHAGFILVGVQAATNLGVAGSLFYVVTYTFMVAGSFGVITIVGRTGDGHHSLDDYRGLSSRRPLLAFTFTVLLLAQAGVPLTAGFFAKFYVLEAAVDAKSYSLAVIAMLATVISAFIYLRIIVAMYMADPAEATEGEPLTKANDGIRVPFGAALALTVCLAFTVVFGFLPAPVAHVTRDAVPTVTAAQR